MKIILGLLIALAIAGGVVWYYADKRGDPNAQEAKEKVKNMAEDAKSAIKDTKIAIQDKMPTSDEIKDELSRTGQVIRRKAHDAGAAIADATADARITTAIKAKIAVAPGLPAFGVSVNTTAGRVTLSGSVDSPELIAKAMQIALETDGVQEVISTIQVK